MSSDVWCSEPPEQSTLMRLPSWDWVVAYSGSAVELSGFIIGVVRWRRIARGQQLITLWFSAAVLSDIAVIVTAQLHQSTQSIAPIWFASSVIFALGSLAVYQSGDRRAAVVRVSIGVYLAVSVILLMTIEPLGAISTYAAPLHALVILAAAVLTLLRRASLGRGELLVDPGFLIAAGLTGYAVAAVFETLVTQLWVHDFPQYVKAYYATCDVLTALSEFVIIKALFASPYSASRRAG